MKPIRSLLRIAMVALVLALAGCGSSGVQSVPDAERWLRDEFTSDVMEISDVSCENAPRNIYLCELRAVTTVGVVTSVGYLDCDDECAWRPTGD